MTPLIWHPAAQQELVHQADAFAQIDPRLVTQFNSRVSHCLQAIRENPQAYHERKFEIRRANLSPKFGE